MKKQTTRQLVLGLFMALVLFITTTTGVFAATTADVTVTYTPEYVAITNSNANWYIGNVAASTTYWWTNNATAPAEPFPTASMNSTIVNTGSVTTDVDIKATNPTGGVGHTLSTDGSAGEDEISLRAGINGTANDAAMIQVITTDTELADSIPASANVTWCVNLTTGTFTDGTEKTTTITLTGSVAD